MAADPNIVEGSETLVWQIAKYVIPAIAVIGIVSLIVLFFRIKLEKKLTRFILSTRKFPKCPDCDGKLVKKHGKYGPFLGCSNYPNCRYTRKIEK